MRTFEDSPAKREGTPLWVGLAGPSGFGKTYSALRIAAGIQKVTGGDIFGIDTEARRMLHYADYFKFRHLPFGPPFRSLDYLQAILHCAKKGARIIVVDSMSHEHDGSGGYLEFHAQEEDKLRAANNSAAKFAAWQKPSKERNDLIQGMLQLPISFVLCFRAKEKLKPGKEAGKSVMRELGWMPIGGTAFIYEMTVCCLLPPTENKGTPAWDVKNFSPEQKLWIKKPRQFEHLFKEGTQISEAIGSELAKWANGGSPPPEDWYEKQAAAVSGATKASLGPEPEKGPDASFPCAACKTNPPRCKDPDCKMELIFVPSGFKRGGSEVFSAFWYCPQKCKDPEDRRRNTNIKATDWHAIVNHEQQRQREPGDDDLFISEKDAAHA